MTDVDRALEELNAGRPIVVPTDTVYGIAAMPDVGGAIQAIFDAKGRPEDKPLPVLAADADALESVARFDDRARSLASRFWPGPLTLVLPRAAGFVFDLGGEEWATVAVRVPAHPVTVDLLRRAGPLAVTSANRSGEEPATNVGHAYAALGHAVAVFLDGGDCANPPSTVVSLVNGIDVLREGAIPPTALT